MSAPAGWHQQPDGRERYWDGANWTDQYRSLILGSNSTGPTEKPKGAGPSYKPWMGYVGAGLAGIAIGLPVGSLGDGVAGNGVEAARPTVTVRTTTTADPPVVPTPDPVDFSAGPKDFTIAVKLLSQKCFGSAGCNVKFRIVPEYVGLGVLPSEGTVEVTYQVTGGEDPLVNTFTIEESSASFDSEETLQTPSAKAKLIAVATEVSYSP